MGSTPKDERVSLHPLDPREALKALLGTKPSNASRQPGAESDHKGRSKKRR